MEQEGDVHYFWGCGARSLGRQFQSCRDNYPRAHIGFADNFLIYPLIRRLQSI
jgi:hypothetical protein